MQRWKVVVYNVCFALNCLLIFFLLFENRLYVPAWIQVIGRMHPLMVHFPIVLFLLTIFWELFPGKTLYKSGHTKMGDALLVVTAFTSVITALTGLLLSKESGYNPEMLAWHKWGGVLMSFLSFTWYALRENIRRIKVLALSTAIASLIFIVITGHLGADITHGENFISEPINSGKNVAPVLFEDAVVYTDMVQPIFKLKCEGCHNDKKAKGELLMQTAELLLKGGKSGPLWDSTEADHGLLLRRLHLPLQNKKHMPPAGKPQLSDDEMLVISNWIMKGANFTTKVSELPETDTLKLLATNMFTTIETDDYSFEPADEAKVRLLHNNYRTVTPLAIGSPALGVEFFGAAQFKPEQLKELANVKNQIVSLNLNKMPLTDNDLTMIGQFVNLRKLNLSFTNINGSGLAALKTLVNLKHLSLSGTAVTSERLQVLSGLPNLTQLYIWSTPAQSENLAVLKKRLPNTLVEKGFSGDTVTIKLSMPVVENEEEVVMAAVPLKMKHFVKNVAIHYTIDGTDPDSLKSPVFKNDVTIDRNMTIKAKAFKQGWGSSDIVEKTFFKAGYTIDSIMLVNEPDPKYKSTGAGILTDTKKGDFNFGNGKWLGFREKPLESMIVLSEPKNISSVTVSSLVDINGYLMPPQEIVVWGGTDPGQLRVLKRLAPAQPVKEMPSYIKGFELPFDPVSLKYIKVVIRPVAKLPAWHRGKGDKGWVFVDEIFLN